MARHRRMRVEPLEDRRMLSITVNTLVDEADGSIVDGDISLRDAIALTPAGETIDFSVTGTIALTLGELAISKGLTINGPGADLLTINASGNDPTPEVNNGDGSGVFSVSTGLFNPPVTISRLTITGADGPSAVFCDQSQLSLLSVKVMGNNGHGVSVLGGILEVSDSTLSGNTADKGAGIHLSFWGGSSFPETGPYLSYATITNSVISGNTAAKGSAIYGLASSVTLIDSTVSGNLGASAAIDMHYAWVPHRSHVDGRVALDNTDVVNNEGDGIRTGLATIADSDVSGNAGMGLLLEARYDWPVNISNSRFNNNAMGMSLQSAGFDFDVMPVTIEGSEIKNNTTDGGLTLFGWLDVEISETTISGNHNAESGGGITSVYGSPLLLRNSTVSGNSSEGSGGGIFAYSLTLENSTVTGNSASVEGGGISAGGVTLRNSIVAENTAGVSNPDIAATSINADYSLIGDTTGLGSITGTGNIVGVDPLLGPLQDNGGPTFTHALLTNSPAIDAGDPAFASPPLYDQRGVGFDRVFGGRIDMGAFERQPEAESLVVTTELDVVDEFDNLTSLREAILYANSLAGADTVTFDTDVFGTEQTISMLLGEYEITDSLTISGTGAALLTIDAGDGTDGIFNTGDGFRVFDIGDDDFSNDLEVSISGLTITGGDVTLSDDFSFGGGILNEERLFLTNCMISGNACMGTGGGVGAPHGVIDILNCTISGNSAGTSGGGVTVFEALNISNTIVSDNTADIAGGGIAVTGIDATIHVFSYCTISGNNAFFGGGIHNITSDINVYSCTIAGNSAVVGGGMQHEDGTATIWNSTFSGNSADSLGGGFVNSRGDVAIRSTSITGNSATRGGGISNGVDSSLTLEHSIISGNLATTGREVYQDTIGGSTFSTNFNLFGHSGITNAQAFAGFTPGASNITATSNGTIPTALTNILDTTLADNGGPTLTHALVAGSPAIDAGDPAFASPPDYDQRGVGFDRVVGGRIDIGAFEVQSETPPPSADFDGDGDVDGRDFLAWQRGFGTSGATQGDGDADHDEDVDGDDLGVWQEQYGTSQLSVVGGQLLDSQELRVESQEPELDSSLRGNDNGPVDPGSAIPGLGLVDVERETASDVSYVFEGPYVEELDRALETFAPWQRFGVSDFGTMVARRAVKRPH